MGIEELAIKRLSLDEILNDLADDLSAILHSALVTRKGSGASRFFEMSGERIVKALKDDGYTISRREVDEWRREHGC